MIFHVHLMMPRIIPRCLIRFIAKIRTNTDEEVMNHHVESGHQPRRIHHDVRCFIADGADGGPFTYRGNDLVVEKMIDSIESSVFPLQQLGVLLDLYRRTTFHSYSTRRQPTGTFFPVL